MEFCRDEIDSLGVGAKRNCITNFFYLLCDLFEIIFIPYIPRNEKQNQSVRTLSKRLTISISTTVSSSVCMLLIFSRWPRTSTTLVWDYALVRCRVRIGGNVERGGISSLYWLAVFENIFETFENSMEPALNEKRFIWTWVSELFIGSREASVDYFFTSSSSSEICKK